MKEINKKRLQILEDTLKYYSQDPKERRCQNDGQCLYSGETAGKQTDGCAVGRLLEPELRSKLDIEYTLSEDRGSSVSFVFDELPKDIQELGEEFLTELQGLHDGDRHWTDTGVSEDGKTKYNDIKECINTECYE